MYNEAEYGQSKEQLNKRLLVYFSVLLIAFAGIIISFIFRIKWLTIMITIVGGSILLLMYSLFIYPVRAYRKHLWYVLYGKQRDTSGYISSFNEEDEVLRDGVSYYSLTINVGEKNDEEDERLFYYDREKLPFGYKTGERVNITAQEKLIANIAKI